MSALAASLFRNKKSILFGMVAGYSLYSFYHLLNKKKAKPLIGPTKECSICLADVSILDFTPAVSICDHESFICTSCLCKYIDLHVREDREINVKCPQPGCQCRFQGKDIQRIAGETIYAMYLSLVARHEIMAHEQFRYCNNAQCGFGKIINLPDKCTQSLSSHCKWICDDCETENCFEHECLWEVACSDANSNITKIMKNYDFKQCPSCHIGIEKISGCNKLTCANCKSIFCWSCRNLYENGFCRHSVTCLLFYPNTLGADTDIDEHFYHLCDGYSDQPVWLINTEEHAAPLPEPASESWTSWVTEFLGNSDTSNESSSTVTAAKWVIEHLSSADDSDDESMLESTWASITSP